MSAWSSVTAISAALLFAAPAAAKRKLDGPFVWGATGAVYAPRTQQIVPTADFTAGLMPRDSPVAFAVHGQYVFASGEDAALAFDVELHWRFRPAAALALYPLLGLGAAFSRLADGSLDSPPILRLGGGAEYWNGHFFAGLEAALIGSTPGATAHAGWRF